MSQRTTNFLVWEFVALFFLLSYSEVMDTVGTSSVIETSTGTIIQWFWVLMMLFSFGVGLLKLKKR